MRLGGPTTSPRPQQAVGAAARPRSNARPWHLSAASGTQQAQKPCRNAVWFFS
jgi:hypothetical protein